MTDYTAPALRALDAAHATSDPLGLAAVREYADWLEETAAEWRVMLARLGQPVGETEMDRAARMIQVECARYELLAKAEFADDHADSGHVVRNTLLLLPGSTRTHGERKRPAREVRPDWMASG